MAFRNRDSAGDLLATRLEETIGKTRFANPLVLALPRGGVPIAALIADRLKAPLEVLIVRKIGAPMNPELGIGAITEDGFHRLNEDLIRRLGVTQEEIHPILKTEALEVARRVAHYRRGRPFPSVRDRAVIVVDDGVATGVTASVAAQWLKRRGASPVMVAAPVCAAQSAKFLRTHADQVVCLQEPEDLYSIGIWYEKFPQLTDEEVMFILNRHKSKAA